MGDKEEFGESSGEDEERIPDCEEAPCAEVGGEESGAPEAGEEGGQPAPSQQSLGKLEPKRVIEAALFISSKPLSLSELGGYIGVAAPGFVEGLLKALAAEYDSAGSAVKIAEEPGGYIMRLRTDYAAKVAPLAQEAEISRGALKILAYISQNEGIEQSKVADTLGSTIYERIKELVDKGFLDKQRKGRTSVLRTTQKFRDYFGA
jgi:segregation and condensation protein B